MQPVDAVGLEDVVGAVQPDERHRDLLELTRPMVDVDERVELRRKELGSLCIVHRATRYARSTVVGRHAPEAELRGATV